MGDRNRFEIMPTIKDVTVRDNLTRNARKLEYQHENEIAQPDYYSVTFENNIKVEMTPTSHAAVFKVTYPSSQTSGSLIFDSYILSSNTRKFDFVNNTFSG
jgi:putative alpha-1,2-mannosidase